MKLFNFFRLHSPRSNAAAVAKERLQIIVSHESSNKKDPDFVKKLQLELVEVISKYIKIDHDQIKVQLERNGDHSVLELNVTLPEQSELVKAAEAEVTTETASEAVAEADA